MATNVNTISKEALSLHRKAHAKKLAYDISQYVIATIIFIIMVFPFYYLIITSFMTQAEVMAPRPAFWPKTFKFDAYKYALELVPIGKYIVNTLAMTAGHMGLQLVSGILAGYGFARGKFKGREMLFTFCLGAMMIPSQVTFVPLYVMMSGWGLINTLIGLIIPGMVSAYYIFMLRQSFKSVDDSYVEAAQIDGMGRLGVIFHVLVPMCKSTIITVTCIAFINGWNSYFWPKMITTNQKRRTIALGIQEIKTSLGDNLTMNYHIVMAAAVMAIIPVLLLFLLLQKYILTGLSKAAMK